MTSTEPTGPDSTCHSMRSIESSVPRCVYFRCRAGWAFWRRGRRRCAPKRGPPGRADRSRRHDHAGDGDLRRPWDRRSAERGDSAVILRDGHARRTVVGDGRHHQRHPRVTDPGHRLRRAGGRAGRFGRCLHHLRRPRRGDGPRHQHRLRDAGPTRRRLRRRRRDGDGPQDHQRRRRQDSWHWPNSAAATPSGPSPPFVTPQNITASEAVELNVVDFIAGER